MTRHQLFLAVTLLLSFALFSCEKEDQYTFEGNVSINIGAEFLSLDYQQRTGAIDVTAKLPWTVEGDAEWLTVSKRAGDVGHSKIEVTLAANDSEARFATLKFISGGLTKEFVVSQSAANIGFDDVDYYFSATFGTMPTLYAGIYLLGYNKPSYMFFEREGTFDPAKLPANITHVPYYLAGQEKMRTYMKENILSINRENPTAVFGLLVDDLRSRVGYDWFVAQGIDSSRVKVTMITDGTATYNQFFERFSKEPEATKNWNTIVSDVEKLNWNHSDKYPESRALPEFESWGWAYYMSTMPNYRLVLQHPTLLETTSEYIKEQSASMKLEGVTPYELLSALPDETKTRFYEMAKFDYDHFAGLFDASPKSNLIIIGTNGADALQKTYTQKIYEKYGATHDIFFKPHPSDLSSANYEELYRGLKLLPGKMPFEIFIWALNDKIDIVGGFESTVFITVPPEKVKFFFAPNAANLTSPLDILFKDAQNIEWIQ